MENIQNIIFDLGGVILDLETEKTFKAFKSIGFLNVEQWMKDSKVQEVLKRLETGKINRKVFFAFINQQTGTGFSDLQITECWNAMLLGFPLARLQLLQQLQLHFNLYLLSNTNEIHEECFNAQLKAQVGFPSLNVFFDKSYLSHRVGLRKPDKRIFELVLSQNNLMPVNTLFIDDTQQNIEMAKQLGIQTILLKDDMTIEDHVFRKKT